MNPALVIVLTQLLPALLMAGIKISENVVLIMGLVKTANDQNRDLTDEEVEQIKQLSSAAEQNWAAVLKEMREALPLPGG